MLGESSLPLLREKQLPVCEHVELALLALDGRRLEARPLGDLGRETRGPAVVAVSDGAVVDLDLHAANASGWLVGGAGVESEALGDLVGRLVFPLGFRRNLLDLLGVPVLGGLLHA